MRRVLLPPTISAEPPPAGAEIVAFGGASMGTSWSARAALPRGAWRAADLQAGLQLQLDQVVSEMSHWEPHSDLGRFNRAGACTWHTLPGGFFDVLQYALEVARDSGGACDPCAGALVNLWGFGPTGRHDQPGFVAPAPRAVAAVRAGMDGRAVALDIPRRRAFQPGGVQLDLSAVAKGYAVDRLARYLEEQGVRNYLVEAGGELRGAGFKPDGQPWWVALEEPLAGAGEIAVALHGLAVATSGDYRKYFMQDATRRPHTIDPRSGMPVAHALAAVTVVHERAMAADAWSTALTVLGPEHGLALAERKRLAARFLLREGAGLREILSSRFQKMLEEE
ncbi:FAD:protein FMN transferase [Pseudoduganella violaceinigra]|uniref:FAD:protein FMN transferase n=1 Tax=Pseudoduganella violaceinigra TaxID=246602 RepID=UPI0004041EBF|nr:FAD:protein FMN transferase [Pseudoduganella violaceinigra]